MTTLRAAAHKFTPVGKALSVRGLADHLGLGGTLSGRDLLRRLAPQSRDIESGDLGPVAVTGRAQLFLFSDGFWSFRGHVHNSGFVGEDYAFGIMINFVGPGGEVYTFANSGTVHGTGDIGSRNDDWQQDGWDRRISANWDALATSGAHADLKVSANPLALVEDLTIGLLAAAGIGVAGILVAMFASDPQTECKPTGYVDSLGGAGAGIDCRREYP